MSNEIRAINEDFGEDTESVNEHETILRLNEQLDEIYDMVVGDDGRKRYTHEEIIDRLKEYYDCYAWVCDFGSFVDVHNDLVKQRGGKDE